MYEQTFGVSKCEWDNDFKAMWNCSVPCKVSIYSCSIFIKPGYGSCSKERLPNRSRMVLRSLLDFWESCRNRLGNRTEEKLGHESRSGEGLRRAVLTLGAVDDPSDSCCLRVASPSPCPQPRNLRAGPVPRMAWPCSLCGRGLSWGCCFFDRHKERHTPLLVEIHKLENSSVRCWEVTPKCKTKQNLTVVLWTLLLSLSQIDQNWKEFKM